MPFVEGGYRAAELRGGRADDQIVSDHYSAFLQLGPDARVLVGDLLGVRDKTSHPKRPAEFRCQK